MDRDGRQQQEQHQPQGQQGVMQGAGPGLLVVEAPVAAAKQVEAETQRQQRQGQGEPDQATETAQGRFDAGEAPRQQQRAQLQHQQQQPDEPQLAQGVLQLVATHDAVDLVAGVPGPRVGHGEFRCRPRARIQPLCRQKSSGAAGCGPSNAAAAGICWQRRQVVAHEKFFYFDAGVYRSLRPAGPLDSPAELFCRGWIRCSRCRCPDPGVSSQI